VKYNGFIVAPDTLLTAGQAAVEGEVGPFPAAVNIKDGSEVWRERLPAAVVKGGAAVDRDARILVSLEDGRVLCFTGRR